MRDLLHHKTYLIFWGSIALVFLLGMGGIFWKLHQIVQLLRDR